MLAPPSQQRFTDKVMGVLRDPSSLPPEFAAWVRGQIVRNPTVKLDSYQLPTVDKKHLVGATGEPAFQNSWVNFGGTTEVCSYWKDLSGTVHLQGLCKSGTVATGATGTIFTLPVTYRPTLAMTFVVISNGAIGRVDVNPDGTVVAYAGNNTYFSLCGLSFRA